MCYLFVLLDMVEFTGKNISLGFVGLMAFLAFILGCVSVSVGNSQQISISNLEEDIKSLKEETIKAADPCPYGEFSNTVLHEASDGNFCA